MPLNNHLRKEWRAAGYTTGNGSAGAARPPRSGFKRLYYLTSSDHAISNLVFGRVKISRFSELNDPFELLGSNVSGKKQREAVRDHKTKFDAAHGLVCFSEDWTDPVLWSHYSQKRRGVALGFDVDAASVRSVDYEPLKLKDKLKGSASSIDKILSETLVYSKFESWRYEREWRLVVSLDQTEKEGSTSLRPV